jgi:phosphopantetheinyl transferase (holo-ACP synthase)
MLTFRTPWEKRAIIVSGAPERSWFTDGEMDVVGRFKLTKRREEWMLSRAAAKQLAMMLGLCQSPRDCVVERPALRIRGEATDWLVSVSHSAGYAAAAIARDPVGIDVQVVRQVAEWASHLFLSDEETRAMERCSTADRLLHFWCAKEAAWKQQSDRYETMKQTPLRIVEERGDGLLFDRVETMRMGELIVAVTR